MQIPILADTTKAISARYGVLIEKLGIALRGLFVIDPDGLVKQVRRAFCVCLTSAL